ncbi:MAG: CPBP family intramembrane metalloprotease [Proteobacteria bacterium]|nr:CPBP family intramembrane metalloprotease [Pseudomonadota bacterium]
MLIGSDLLSYSLGRPIVPEIMVELYRTSHFVALSWFAIVIAAPIFEEVFFRGFMFRGIQASGLGNGGAILITASTWAAMHAQYDAYGLATILVVGIFLGLARAVTGSLYLTTAMHMATNLIATIEIHLFAGS